MLFSYKIKLKTGEVSEGMAEAIDRFALSRDFRLKGSTPISITEKKDNPLDLDRFFSKFFGSVSASELIVTTKNLSGMIKAGLPLSRALSVIDKQTKNKILKKIIVSLSNDINAGSTLSDGLAKFPKVFSKLFVSMVRAGEESGNLALALTEIGMNLEKSSSINKKIKGALMYPGVILSAMILIGIALFAFVVPTLAKTFKQLGVKLPPATQFIVGLGNFFSEHLLLAIVMLILITFGLYSLFRAKFMAKYIDYAIIRMPMLGTMVKELNTARTARTLSSLLASGVSISRAIDITGDVVQNMYYKEVLVKARLGVEKGAPFSRVFEENQKLYPIMMSEMIQVGEETGKLSEMLLEIASFYEAEIDNKTKNLSTIIEPVLMIFIGAGVGFFAISMIAPLYSILDSIK